MANISSALEITTSVNHTDFSTLRKDASKDLKNDNSVWQIVSQSDFDWNLKERILINQAKKSFLIIWVWGIERMAGWSNQCWSLW